MNTKHTLSFIAAASLLLAGCAYKVGSIGGEQLAGVTSVYVPVIKNDTYEPGVSVMITNSIIQRLHNDGTLEVKRKGDADSELDVRLLRVERRATRSVRNDTRLVAEYRLVLVANYTFTSRNGKPPVIGEAEGRTEFFVGADMQEGERQAIGMAADDLAKNIVEKITENW